MLTQRRLCLHWERDGPGGPQVSGDRTETRGTGEQRCGGLQSHSSPLISNLCTPSLAALSSPCMPLAPTTLRGSSLPHHRHADAGATISSDPATSQPKKPQGQLPCYSQPKITLGAKGQNKKVMAAYPMQPICPKLDCLFLLSSALK